MNVGPFGSAQTQTQVLRDLFSSPASSEVPISKKKVPTSHNFSQYFLISFLYQPIKPIIYFPEIIFKCTIHILIAHFCSFNLELLATELVYLTQNATLLWNSISIQTFTFSSLIKLCEHLLFQTSQHSP